MKVKAVSKDVRISPQKVGMITEMVRGKRVEEALTMLKFMPSPAARAVAKTIKSAAANAENNYQMLPTEMRIADIFAGKGHVARRFRPQARGRVAPILRRASHIAVVLTEEKA
ncbi:MAG: 50S ribosomal protein L22 [Chloroflexota bacterium]